MALVSRSLLLLGSILLVHAAYSAHEHTALLALSTNPSSSAASSVGTIPTTSGLTSLPLDITLETIISVIILCVAIVSGSEQLKPISWRVWAAGVEKKKVQGKTIEGEGYGWLEKDGRRGFLDIRTQRKDFAQWAKGNK